MALRETKKQERLARIEKVGRALFAEQGFENTTTREIAARAGMATGTLFLYFPEKRDLLLHLFRQDIGRLETEAFASLPATGPLARRLEHLFGVIYDWYAADERLGRVFVKELMFLEGQQRQAMLGATSSFLGRLSGLVQEAIENGELPRTVIPFAAAYQFFGAYYFSLVAWLGGGLPSLLLCKSLLAASIATIVRGLAATPVEGSP